MKAVIEMPKGTTYKYEVDKQTGRLKLDRPLSIPVPFNYGFIKNTMAPDGDPLDVFLVAEEPIPPLTEVEIEIVGGYLCKDGGVEDEKLVAVIKGSKMFESVLEWSVYPAIEDYLTRYKPGFELGDFMESWDAESLAVKYGAEE